MSPPAAESLTASRKRRRIRLRSTAPPVCRVTVKPTRTTPSSPRERACRTNARFADRTPPAAARKSPRRFSRSMTTAMLPRSGTEPLAPLRAAIGEHSAAALCRHARAEAMPPFAHQFARLIGPFHGFFSAARPPIEAIPRNLRDRRGLYESPSGASMRSNCYAAPPKPKIRAPRSAFFTSGAEGDREKRRGMRPMEPIFTASAYSVDPELGNRAAITYFSANLTARCARRITAVHRIGYCSGPQAHR